MFIFHVDERHVIQATFWIDCFIFQIPNECFHQLIIWKWIIISHSRSYFLNFRKVIPNLFLWRSKFHINGLVTLLLFLYQGIDINLIDDWKVEFSNFSRINCKYQFLLPKSLQRLNKPLPNNRTNTWDSNFQIQGLFFSFLKHKCLTHLVTYPRVNLVSLLFLFASRSYVALE